MNKLKFITLKSLIVLCLAAILVPMFATNTANISYAQNKISIDSSKFIYNPAHSVFYQNKLYFIDTYDDNYYFKVFSTNSENDGYAEYSQKLDFEVVDAHYTKDLYFILTNSSIAFVDISKSELSINFLSEVEFENNAYSSIFVYYKESEYIITLTPSNLTETNPLVILINQNNIRHFEISDTNLNSVSSSTRLAITKISENNYCYLYFGESKVKYIERDFSSTAHGSIINITNGANDITNSQLDCNSKTKVANINILYLNDGESQKEYFLLTYKREIATGYDYYRNIYSYDFSEKSNFKFTEAEFSEFTIAATSNSPFTMTNGDYITYPNFSPNPEIIYAKVSTSQIIENHIENPQPTINNFEEINYQIKSTNQNAYLLQNPWDITSEIELLPNTDILVVGTPVIGTAEVENLYYCLYTSKDEDSSFDNNYGYISANFLSDKTDVTFEELGLASTVKVYPDTCVYALPSKASDIKLETNGKYAVEIIDLMKSYTTDTIEWVRVRIGSTTGYIDRNRINFAANKVNFITTNATITRDGTYVYSEARASSSLIYNKALMKGKNVYIDGSRDTKTGFTKIKFNDDYGNEFEGYIKTENIKSDSWSQLQIIGSILIAINFGILILILVFKKKKLSKPEHHISTSDVEVLN